MPSIHRFGTAAGLCLVWAVMGAGTALAQGIGPSSGPLDAVRPAADPGRRWFLAADLIAAVAPGKNIVGLNQFVAGAPDSDLLGARYYLQGRATAGAAFDAPVIEGVFAFFELTSTHGENVRGRESSWGPGQVAWARRYGAGLVLPRGWLLYAESRGRWHFPGREGDFVDGPFEIYNFVWVGNAFELRPGSAPEWFFRGYLEGGLTFPHNEIAFNVRRPDQPETAFFGDNYARYALRGTVRVGRAAEWRGLREVSVYVNPFFGFGRNIPQQEYTWEPRYIGARRCLGVELLFAGGWRAFGEYQHDWSFADERAVPGTGPYERYFVIGVAKAFRHGF